jgi:AsmA family protein
VNRRRRWALAAALLAGLPLAAGLAALIAALIAAFVAGVSIDASRWREQAAQQASAALGRPVALSGTLRLKLGRQITLHVGRLQVANPPGFTTPLLADVSGAQLVLDTADVLRGALRMRRIEAGDVTLWLERTADGRGNWAAPAPRAPAADGTGIDIDIGQLRLARVAVRYLDAGDTMHRQFDFEAVSGGAPAGGSVQLQLRGLLGARPAYRLTLDGGPLHLLQGGAEPWPFRLAVRADAARLTASGTIDARAGSAVADFSASVDDPARSGAMLGLALPPLGRVSLAGRASARAGSVELSELRASLPGIGVEGRLAVNFTGPRPRWTGALAMGDIDLRPSLDALAAARAVAPAREHGGWPAFALPSTLPFDADLALDVGHATGGPVDLRALSLRLTADARGLRVPVAASVNGAEASGRIELDTRSATPQLALQVDARALPLSALLLVLGGVDGVDGQVARLGVRASGTGRTLGEWVTGMEARAEMAGLDLVYRADGLARPLALQLERAALQAPRGERLRGSARGTLLGEPVTASLRAGRWAEGLQGPSLPIELDVAAASARLRLSTDLAAWAAGGDAALDFDFRARRSGELSRWVGVAAASALPVQANARLRLAGDAWHVDTASLQLGRSALTARARGPRDGALQREPTVVQVRSTLLDVPELSTLFEGGTPAVQIGATSSARPIEIPDVDLTVELQQLQLGRVTLHELGAVARTRRGLLLPATLQGRVGSTRWDGTLDADLRGGVPQARLDLSAQQVDVGLLLRELGAAEGIVEGHAETLQMSLQGRGASGPQFIDGAEMRAALRGGQLAVRGGPQRPLAEIRLREADIDVLPGQPLRARLDGTLGRVPVQMDLSTGTLAELRREPERIPFALAARAAGTTLTLEGTAALPLGRDAELRVQFGGDRLDSLNVLSRTDLPAWGPWSISGPVRITPGGYRIPQLQLRVGRSRLDGALQLDLDGPRPLLSLQAAAPSIQLDDFPLPARLSDPPQRAGAANALRRAAGTVADGTDRLLSAGFLRRFDARIELLATEVLAGVDRLGDGVLRLNLSEGRLDVDPLRVTVPGGSLKLAATYDLKESDVDFALSAAIERFDYGVIARRLGRGDDIRGLFSLDLKVRSRAPSLDKVLHHANGQVDIAVWPQELRSGVFNLWTVNLVLTLMPLIDPGGSSAVNCVIGRFDLIDGVLRDEQLFIDTSSVRIRGSGQADLRSETLNFVFRPRAKGFAVFRLQNPLRVTGTLFDQRIGLDRRDLPEAVLRLIASPILWPLERLTLGPLPRNGADLCTDPLRSPAAP